MDLFSDELSPITSVRKLKPTKRSVSGFFAFRGRGLAFESTLERDFLTRTVFCFDVHEIVPQPVQIPFVAPNGRHYLYTPDFLVIFTPESGLQPLLVEVKPRSEWKAHWREWSNKWKAAARHAKVQGWMFHIHDETRIRDVALQNIQFLQPYQRPQGNPSEIEMVLQHSRQLGELPFDKLREVTGASRPLLWHLLATRQLAFDYLAPLDSGTKLWRSQ